MRMRKMMKGVRRRGVKQCLRRKRPFLTTTTTPLCFSSQTATSAEGKPFKSVVWMFFVFLFRFWSQIITQEHVPTSDMEQDEPDPQPTLKDEKPKESSSSSKGMVRK
jgi:hypothetical protein